MKRIFETIVVITLVFILTVPVTAFQRRALHQNLSGKALPHLSVPHTGINSVSPTGTIRIAAIRVDFQADDNQLTTGDGKFDYSENTEAIVDPPPHDRTYFLDQLEALKRYYSRVSNGLLTLEYDLFPSGQREAYSLSREMAYYNPNTTEDEIDIRLSELLRDAVMLADADIDFSQFDAVIVFHAGVGSDYLLEDAALDPTPHDLPSVHLSLRHLQETLGLQEGISVENGAVFVTSGTILPETESKRDIEIGLFGIMAHQFGHELGLPSLFNTESGRPAIGKFGLMGVGFTNVDGVLPAEPCAWSKVYMGWEDPVIVTQGNNLPVSASQTTGGTRIYKVPITPTEYYLIENRIRDYADDGLNFVKGQSGVILEFDDYDFDIPGSGLLIWHIDEQVIREKLEKNEVNTDPSLRGIDLEEADGSQDIGELFPGILPGFMTPENGWPWDGFYAGNNSEFTPGTVPNSRSNRGGNSHIYITAVSDTGQVMTFSVRREYHIDGFPKYLSEGSYFSTPTWIQPSSPDSAKLIITGYEGKIFALNGRNEPLFNNNGTVVQYITDNDSVVIPAPVFSDAAGYLGIPPLVGSYDYPVEAFRNKLIVTAIDKISREPSLLIYSLVDADMDNYGDLIRRIALPEPTSTPLLLGENIVVGFDEGYIRQYDFEGNMVNENRLVSSYAAGFAGAFNSDFTSFDLFVSYNTGEIGRIPAGGAISLYLTGAEHEQFAPVFSDFDGVAGDEIYVPGLNEDYNYIAGGEYSVSARSLFSTSPAAGDINGDGKRELAGAGGSQIFALNHNETMVTGFPVDIQYLGYADYISTHLILGDVTGDGKQNILFGTSNGNLFALNADGTIVPGFPLPVGGGIAGSPTLLRSTNADRMELAVLSVSGYLYLFDLETTYDDKVIAWGTFSGNNARWRHNTETLIPIAAPPVNELMPPDRVYNWPNPNEGNWTKIRYYLNSGAEVTVKIYNQAGDLIAELDGPGAAGFDNEIQWNLDNIQSGVYYADVRAAGNGMTARKTIKIAVVK
ncbi:hypothetical protein ACFL6L_01840 [candidate division KSB1 bacterium]